MKLTTLVLPLFSLFTLFSKKCQSIMLPIERHFFNNFSLVKPGNYFSSSLIFLIVFFKLSKFSCVIDDLVALSVGYY